jgi:cardiolipin synthase A/B
MQLIPLTRTQAFYAPLMVSGNRVDLLHDGAMCFPAMLTAIDEAEHEIVIEMYWFASDRTGRKFADALSAKARAGVRVFVIYDAIGSIEADDAVFEGMIRAGCEVEQYNPVSPLRKRFRLGVVHRRDHRKILVVDQRIAFTGGINLGDPWAPEEEGGGGWRDDMIRVEGVAALQLRDIFFHTWRRVGRTAAPIDLPRPPPEIGDCHVRALANFYLGERLSVRREYLSRIRAAKERVYITNSYFVPDRTIRNELAKAVARGVKVKVIVPGESDLVAVQYASKNLYGWLLDRGIEIWEWQRTILHAKTAVVDREWCTVGTYNLDYRSWRLNLEVTVSVEDRRVSEQMAAQFERDLDHSISVPREHQRFRPITDRMLENFFYFFRKLL